MSKKEAKILILWLLAFIIMLSLLIAFPILLGYAAYEGQQNIINLTSCQDLTVSNATYYLQNDVSASGICFNITANNIILDGSGHLIFNASLATVGIYASHARNITIINTKVSMDYSAGYGIYFYDVNSSLIKNNLVYGNSIGIRLSESNNNQLTSNTANNNSNGIYIECISCTNNNLIDNTANSNLNYGIYLNALADSSIINNKFDSNNHGLIVSSSSNNNIKNNTAQNNNYGFYLSSSRKNTLINNIANSNKISGFHYSGTNDTLMNNVANNNVKWGIALFEASFTNVLNNFLSFNGNSSIHRGGIIVTGNSNNNIIANNTLYSNYQGIVLAVQAENFERKRSGTLFANNFIGGDIANSVSYAIFIDKLCVSACSSQIFNNFTDIIISNTSNEGYDFKLNSAEDIGTYLIDLNIINYSINNSLVYFKKTGAAEIKFLQLINGLGNDLSSEIKISNNFVFINESNEGLNKSAKISLYNIPTAIANASILRNGILCNGNSTPACYNLTALDAGNVVFNVTRGGSYNIKYDLVGSSQRIISSDDSNKTSGVGNTYEISEEDAIIGVTSSIGSLDKIIIKSGDKRYELRVQIINNASIYLQVDDNPTEILLFIGDITNIDVNSDGVFDYEITLLSIENDKPALFIKKTLVETFDAKDDMILTAEGDKGVEQKKESATVNKGKIIYYFTIALLSIGMAAVVFLLIKFYTKGEKEKILT